MFPVHLYPYSNFHDLNLDWILNKVKEVEEKVNQIKTSETLVDDVAQLKADVTNIYNLLNVINQNTQYLNAQLIELGNRVTILENGGVQTVTVETNEAPTEFVEVEIFNDVETGSFVSFSL